MLRATRQALRRHPVRWSAFRLGARCVMPSLLAMATRGLVPGVELADLGLPALAG